MTAAPKHELLRVCKGGFVQVDDFVSKSQIKRWFDHIIENRSVWLPFDWHVGSYFYVHSWYGEIETGHLARYHTRSVQANQTINLIPGFLDTMKSASQFLVGPKGETNLPVRSRSENLGPYWTDSSLHILGGTDAKKNWAGGEIHCDFEGLAPYPAALFSQDTLAFSCIVSVALPAVGGNLEIWPERRVLASEAMGDEVIATPGQSKILEYKVGQLSIIDSFLFHRIGPCVFDVKNPWRISAVIHFLYREKPYPHWEHWF